MAKAENRLVRFRYAEKGPFMPRAVEFERMGGRIARRTETLDGVSETEASEKDMEALEALVESLGLLRWKRLYRLPDGIVTDDGCDWRVEFVFEDGVRHLRRGGTDAEPPNYGEFRERMSEFGIDGLY